MITRRDWLILAGAATGCATPGRPLEEAFPPALPGGWQLRRSAPLRPEEVPPEVRGGALRRSARAEYSGPVVLTLTLNEMKSSGNAFELVQRWRAGQGRMAFHHGRFFGIAEAPGASRAVLQQFVDAFDKRFGGAD